MPLTQKFKTKIINNIFDEMDYLDLEIEEFGRRGSGTWIILNFTSNDLENDSQWKRIKPNLIKAGFDFKVEDHDIIFGTPSWLESIFQNIEVNLGL